MFKRVHVRNHLDLLAIKVLCAFAIVFSLSICAKAAENNSDEQVITENSTDQLVDPATSQAKSQQEIGLFATFDPSRDYLSQKVVSYATNIDHFFGDERYFQEENHSVIQIYLDETFSQGGNKNFQYEGKAKLDLPAAQKRFQVVLEYNPEQKTIGDVKKDQPSAQKESGRPEQYSAALRYENAEESRWHFSSDAGAKFQFPLEFFTRARGSYSIPLGEWRLKAAETIFWFGTIGLGETTQVDLEYLLGPSVLFRATSTATCLEVPQNCDLRQDFAVFQTLSDRAALQYQASILGVSEPDPQETAYVLLTRYRYRLHKDWVYYEVTPQLNFPRTDGFRINASLMFRLEMLFGATK